MRPAAAVPGLHRAAVVGSNQLSPISGMRFCNAKNKINVHYYFNFRRSN